MADEGEDKAVGATSPGGIEQAATPGPRREQSEWTVSDKRGPLSSAERAGADHTTPAAEELPSSPEIETTHEAEARHVAEPPASHADGRSDGERMGLPIVPVVLALIVGAIIGGGSSVLISVLNGGGSDAAQVAALGARIKALESRPDPQGEIDALKSQIASRQTFDPAPLQQKIAGLQADVEALKQKGAGDPQLDSKVAALGGSVDALKAQGDGMKDLDGKVTTLSAAVDGLKQQDSATQAGLAAVRDGQKALDAKITSAPALAVVADSLVEAIRHGAPYADQVAALGSLGADPVKVAVLKENADKGVPSAQALAKQFRPLADPILAAANKSPPNAGLMDRLKSGMASMVSVRSAGASDGDDVGSRVSRIEADLVHDDVAGAYSTWEGLPADARAKSDAWGALAKTHVEAMDAAHALQQQAITSLGGKKS